MATKATEHVFNGTTTPLTFTNYGTVAVSTTAVTGTGTYFTAAMVGMKIGFGATYISGITTWYTISTYTSPTSITLSTSAGTITAGSSYVINGYDSTKTCLGPSMVQRSGLNPEDNFVGPFPVAIARPYEESTAVSVMDPSIITISDTIDWIFLTENATGATTTRRIFLYEFNKVTFTYNWKGFITTTFPQASTTTRGFKAIRYLHTTGTVGVAAPVAVLSDSTTVTAVIAGTVTHSGTGFLPSHVGLMMGFGSNDVTKINCWYPIISNTNSSTLVVSGITSAFAAGTAFVIASCVVTGSATKNFVEEGLAAGASIATAAGLTSGLGPRIGFGSTNPNLITQWYQIGKITDDTHINLVTSPGVIPAGTPYVIEELRFVYALTHGTATYGGLFLLKGVGYLDFTTAGNTFPTIAANALDNERGVYWLSDAGTTANIVTNTSPCGIAVATETNKGLHYAYVIDGSGSTFVKIFRYNLRATGTITTGKMLMNVAYTTTGTVTVTAGTTVTSDASTPFTATMVGMKIGFGSTSPAMITTWYTIVGYTSTSVITINSDPGTVSTSAYIIDSADVIATSGQVVTGAVTNTLNNGVITTLRHGRGKDVECLYFITVTRIYRVKLSKIYAGNIDWIEDNCVEIPPGSVNSYAATGALSTIDSSVQSDRLIVLSTGTASTKHYVTKYPTLSSEPFDRVFGVDTKQLNQSTANPDLPVSFNTNAATSTFINENRICHIVKHGGAVTTTSQLYAIPLMADYSTAYRTDERVITPSISTPNCLSFKRLLISAVDHLGDGPFRLPTSSILTYYRTNGITDNSGEWALIPADGDLSSLAPASSIQFMFEFETIGLLCIPAKIMSIAVLYDDYSTDPHYQPSVGKTVLSSKQFAWRFSTAFGTTVPTLRIRLFDAVTGGLLLDDKTTSPVGTWAKTTDEGATWGAYNTADKTNEITYIRYTPVTLPDNNKVRALLTLY